MNSISIQITNTCNLSCPSCYMGRVYRDNPLKFQYMDAGTLDKILAKIKDFYPGQKFSISLFNYNEPFLHPHIEAIVDTVARHGMNCWASSNLSLQANFAPIINSPAFTRLLVSVSGFTQEVYQRGHRKGSIKTVLDNLDTIAEVCQPGNAGKVRIAFHQYNDNAEDEQRFRAFAQKRGFEFYAYPGVLTKCEWSLQALTDGSAPWYSDHDARQLVMPRLLMPETCVDIPSYSGLDMVECTQQTSEILLDVNGNVYTCCWFGLIKQAGVGNILNDALEDIIAAKQDNPLCTLCKNNAFHITTYALPFLENYLNVRGGPEEKIHSRRLLKLMDNFLRHPPVESSNVPIVLYGAGGLGRFLATLLRQKGYKVVCFIDDAAPLQGEDVLAGLRAYPLTGALNSGELENAYIMLSFDHTVEQMHSISQRLMHAGLPSINTFDSFLEFGTQNSMTKAIERA